MDAVLQVTVDGFKFENGSGSCCKPMNNLDESCFTCFDESESQSDSSSPTESKVCSDYLPVFKYINDMLMEEDLEDQPCMLVDSLALQAAEKSFYEVLQDQSPPTSDQISNDLEDGSLGNFSSITSLHQPTSDIIGSPEVVSEESTRRYHHRDDDLEGGRKSKLPAISTMDELAEKYEEVLLICQKNNHGEASPNKTKPAKGSSNRSKQQKSEQPVDMRDLLMQCAQAVASFDQSRAAEKLKEIRQHSSIRGDATQRLGYHLAEALEARITGTMATPISATYSRTSMVDILKAYKGFVQACPTLRMCYFTANRTIYELASKATTLHIIDFGILYGFQLPCLIQALSNRDGGPPLLRVTGIELPQSGFRPSERVEETGRRLKRFCDKFKVPFEYSYIAKNWEDITLDELVINTGETTVVNCILRLQYTPDETMSLNSPRDKVLKLFRDINPDLFVFAEINGTYNSPFFLTRFREALFHCSALFDMYEATLPEEDDCRTLVERELIVRDAMSVIACEGSERFARPETYKQWQVRILRAGFKPAKLNKEIIKHAKEIVKQRYHKDFVIDNDNHWMLQGWKGRVLYAVSCWKPAKK
ncbi:PREDICTED: scarecrow-like protein 30 isoform X1 [Camelina sativa]|uniref:Scarecrow-like protein 30 isoform X1 n=1 Tax=Camelina sativa TaxID=90675 RepID=A0ABM0ZFE2_CAMSA|nr:PREDICTED: scarecrow-like protein 30 isoform X1 [Camelina sativa]